MNEIICPICGSANDANAEFCQVCRVEFNQLPSELKPIPPSAPEAQEQPKTPPEEDASEVPAWLRKRIKNRNEDQQPSASFDSYLNALFGKDAEPASSPAENPPQSLFSAADLNALESDNAAAQASAGLTEDEKPFADFSQVRPERKWEGPVADDTKEVQLPLEEKVFEDFSVIRPEKKWEDLQPISDLPVYTGSNESENAPLEEAKDQPSPIHRKLEDQMALFDTKEAVNQSSPADLSELGLTEDELPFADFAVNRPARKWDDTADETPSAAEMAAEANRVFTNQLESADEPAEKSSASDQPENDGGLVADFLNQIETSPAAEAEAESSTGAEPADSEDISFAVQPTPAGAEPRDPMLESVEDDLAELLTDAKPDHEPKRNEIEYPASIIDTVVPITPALADSDNAPSAPSAPDALDEEIFFNEDVERDNVSPSDGEPLDDLDEIPWNLFESSEMSLPGMNPEKSYQPFSKTDLSEPAQNKDYQQRMISTILEKIFQIEGLNPPLKKEKSRGTNKFAQLILALVLIGGIVFILISGITDAIPLNPPSAADFPNLTRFNQQLDAVESGSKALILLDYSPGYTNELSEPLTRLAEQLAQLHVSLSVATTNASATALIRQLALDPAGKPIENLGYLPGGVMAAQSLLQGGYQNIYLVSSGFESARSWVEQLSTYASQTPVHLISSAQLESLLTPYYETQALDSFLAGNLEKSLFAGKSLANPQENRKLYALWFLIGMAILAFLAGMIQKNPYQSIVAEPGEETDVPEKQEPKKESHEEGETAHEPLA